LEPAFEKVCESTLPLANLQKQQPSTVAHTQNRPEFWRLIPKPNKFGTSVIHQPANSGTIFLVLEKYTRRAAIICGALFVGDLMSQSKHANQWLTPKQDDFCRTFPGTAGLVTRGEMSRRWQ